MSRMPYRLLSVLGCMVGSSLAVLTAHPARAQCAAFSHELGVELCRTTLSDAELSRLRGGYELVPGVKAFFAFSQIIKVNGETVQSIVVPQVEISATNPMVNFTINGGDGTKILSGGVPVQMTPTGNNTQSALINASPLAGNISVITSANNGNTQVASQFSNSAITSQVSNVSNNAAISTATIISLATQGLPAFIQAQRTASMVLGNMQRSQTISP